MKLVHNPNPQKKEKEIKKKIKNQYKPLLIKLLTGKRIFRQQLATPKNK